MERSLDTEAPRQDSKPSCSPVEDVDIMGSAVGLRADRHGEWSLLDTFFLHERII